MKKLLLLILPVLLLACGCGVREKGDDGEELNIMLNGNPTTMDAQLASDSASAQYLSPISGRLFRYDEDKKIVPELAESYEVSEDGCVYTFKLRDGLRYSNGEEITAEDFVYAFRRIVDPVTASGCVYIFAELCHLKNASEINSGKLAVEELGAYAPDDSTLVMQLEQPCTYLTNILAMPSCAPCSRSFVMQCGREYATSPDTLLSSGPYIVDRYEPLTIQVHYTKNPEYVDADRVKLSGLTIRELSNLQQAMMCYQSKVADVIPIGGEYAVLSKEDPNIFSCAGGTTLYIIGNNESCSAWQNRNIRIALSLAIDRDSIVSGVMYNCGASVLGGIVPDGYSGPDGEEYIKDPDRYKEICGYDPEKAREYWKKGLEELSVKSLTLELVTPSSSLKLVEILKDQWERALPSFTIKPRLVTFPQYLSMLNKQDFELACFGWGADYPDPNAFLELFSGASSVNNSKYSNDRYDSLLEKASLEPDPGRRFKLLRQAEDIIMLDDAGVIPVYSSGGSFMISERVKHVGIDFTGMHLDLTFAQKESTP
ncbi:MAG: peptide ABC transporter substrate-binding protein [Lachnospiraceae bacterium]|nr:peptide ABC transporter substrate-binding protein [Lachnospiraceae bacterium]